MAQRFPQSPSGYSRAPGHDWHRALAGYAAETGLVIPSLDPVAADVVGAKLLGSQVQAVAYLWEAGRLRSSETESEKLEFPVPSLEDALVAFTTAAYGKPLRF
jgi:uncharacterized protein (DUF362 family)